MKVLVFPALLVVAIITTPPKPFAVAETGKVPSTQATMSHEQSAALMNQRNQPAKILDSTSKPESDYTARR